MSHSSRAAKRRHTSQDEGASEEIPGKRERLSSEDGGISRTGRVRKKSSKFLEMEQGMDDLQEVLTGRKSRKKQETDKSGKTTNLLQSGKKKKSSETESASPVTLPPDDQSALPPENEEAPAAHEKHSRKSKGKRGEKVTSPVGPTVSNVKTESDGSLKMTLQLGQSPPAEGTKKKSRKKDVDPLPPLPPLEIPEHQDVTSVMEGDSGLKMKLILSPTKEKAAAIVSSPDGESTHEKKKKKSSRSEGKKRKGKDREGTGIEKIKIKDILAAQQLARDAKAKEQKELAEQSALAMHLGLAPVVPVVPTVLPSPTTQATPVISVSPAGEGGKEGKTKKKKKSKKEGKADQHEQTIPEIAEEIISGMTHGDGDEHGEGGGVEEAGDTSDAGLEIDLTPRGNALPRKKKRIYKKKVKRGSEDIDVDVVTTESPGRKKAKSKDNNATTYADTDVMAMKLMTSQEKKASKKTKKKVPDDPLKPKRRRGPTAYMLWCNTYRNKVIAENPERDFAQISKRLGEIWQGLLEKEKLSWKRKAKKIAAKGSTLITTGKKGGKMGLPSKITSTGPAGKKAGEERSSLFEVHSTSPLDVAAHLKLLGESLSIIGSRLTESRGQIAVQGSLSVMLDSMLCALGPLMCLTPHVPETKAIPDEMLAETLDNIAYIMPGL